MPESWAVYLCNGRYPLPARAPTRGHPADLPAAFPGRTMAHFFLSRTYFVNSCRLKVPCMNILICSTVWSPSIGGVQSVTNTVARGLARESAQSDDAPVELTVATRTPAGETLERDEMLRVVRDAGILRLVWLVWKSDIVHLAGPALVPLFLAWLLRQKAVIHHHGYQAVCPDGSLVHYVDQRNCCSSFAAGEVRECVRCRAANVGWRRGIVSVALGYPRLWLCRRVSANIAVSSHVKERLSLPRTTTIYNAPAEIPDCPADEFLSTKLSSRFVLASDVPLIAFVGRLTSEKGVPVLLHAAATLAGDDIDFCVRIVGGGPERARLAILAWSLRLRERVEFTGMLEGSALEAAVSSAVAVVVPSLAEEAAGLVAIEQMMRGRVVIASDTGGLGEIVGNAGLKFPPGDVAALTACLRRVLGDPELRVALGRAARSRALQHFTQQRMIEDHLQLYRRILARPFPTRPPAPAISRVTLPGRQKRAS